MIWSVEIDYSGWEDDVNHVHFFIEQDDRPTKEQVAEHYNQTCYGLGPDYVQYGWMEKDVEEDEWIILDSYGEYDYTANISIRPLEVETLQMLSKKPRFKKKPIEPNYEFGESKCELAAGCYDDYRDDDRLYERILSNLQFGKQINIEINKEK